MSFDSDIKHVNFVRDLNMNAMINDFNLDAFFYINV